MKKRKGSLLNRMLAALLAAALVVSMVSNAVPVSVLAQEESGAESVSGNDTEMTEEGMETEPALQAGGIASGTDWVLAADGKLTISSDEGMTDWASVRHQYWKQVISVEIKNGVTFIADSAFNYLKYLPEINIPSSVASIGKYAFGGCDNLKNISIPSSAESINIKEGAFYNCIALTDISIPSSVTSIERIAFEGCTSLQNVILCSNEPPTCGESVFKNCRTDLQIHVPVCDYLSATGWSSYKSNIVVAVHTGDISYSASGSVITQKCGGCNTEYGTATLSLSGTNFAYTGAAITPVSVTYADSGTNTWSGEKPDAITYANNINAGTATASLTLGTATATLSFTIRPKTLTDGMVMLPADSFPHTGNAIIPEVTVRDGGTILTKDTDYTVSYTSNSNVGTATVTVTGKNNYSGAITKQFQIVESDADKVAAAKEVVENALAGITATNATTKEEILDVINTAFSNVGITGVTVEIDKFVKREASTSAAGSIEGVIFISCGQAVGSVNMSKPIAQLTAGKYTVTVNSGTGGGEYEAGATVTITADAPASGKQFDQWVVNSGNVTLDDATSSTTTFTMPAGAVSVTATYKTNTGGGNAGDDSDGGHSGSSGDSDSNNNNDNGGSNNNSSNNNNNNNSSSSSDSGGSSNYYDGNEDNGTDTSVGTPKIRIITPLEELEDAVLTETERQQTADGADIRIELDVKVATAEAGAADRALVEEALQGSAAGYTIGQYLDISLYKIIGDSRTAITETDGKITVRIDVPDSLKNTDSSNTRAFAVIRVHDGGAEFLEDLDNDADTITIATDRFSTYAVVYQDTAADTGNSGKDDEPKTGDSMPLELYATLSMIAGFSYLLLYFTDRKRGMTEETKKELVAGIVRWAKRGGRIRKCLALAAIFVLLVYYHSIGKKTCVEWEKIYGE